MNKPARAPRSDGEATRSRILAAAGELFATQGYAETSNKAIAELAQVDLASINYHFGNRGGLYQAVLAHAHGSLLDVGALQQLVGSAMPPASKLRVLTEQLVLRATQEPQAWQLRVLAREILAPSSHLKILLQDEALPKILLLRGLLSQVSGIPAEDPALTRCLLNVLAPCLMLLVGGRDFPGPMQELFQLPAQATADHLYCFALGGLEAVSKAYGYPALPLQAAD